MVKSAASSTWSEGCLKQSKKKLLIRMIWAYNPISRPFWMKNSVFSFKNMGFL